MSDYRCVCTQLFTEGLQSIEYLGKSRTFLLRGADGEINKLKQHREYISTVFADVRLCTCVVCVCVISRYYMSIAIHIPAGVLKTAR